MSNIQKVRKMIKEAILRESPTKAVYYNKITGETCTLAGISDLKKAWSVYKTVCQRTGWNPKTFNDDVKVTLK